MTTSFLLAAALFGAPSAKAQEDPRRVQAEKLMNEGAKLRDAYDAEGALAKFREAYALYPTPNVVFALASTEHFLEKNLEAIRHYREAMRSPTLHPNNVQRGKEYIRQLEAKLCRIEIKAPTGTTLTVDGARVDGPSGEPVDAQPGDHVVEGDKGGAKQKASVHCAAGEAVPAVLSFDGAPAALAVTTAPAEVPKSGSSTTRNIVGGSLAVLGVAAGTVGFVFLAKSNGQVSDAASMNVGAGGVCQSGTVEQCGDYRDQLDDARSSRTISIVGLVAGGALLAGAAITFALWHPSKDATTARATKLLRGQIDF